MAFRAIFEAASDALILIDADGTIALANDRATELFGYTHEELRGKPIEHLVPRRFRDAHAEHRAAFASSPRPRAMGGNLELSAVRKDGQEIPVDVAIARVRLDDGPPRVLAAVRDDADRRRARELERQLMHADRLAAIGQLAAGAAHEINNPATFLLANMASLKRTIAATQAAIDEACAASPDAREILQKRGVAAQLANAAELVAEDERGLGRICAIARSLAGFSRSEPQNVESVDVNEIAEAAYNLTSSFVRRRAEFTRQLGDVTPLEGDRVRLEQVIVNLLRNAAEAIDEGAPGGQEVRLETSTRDDDVVISVSDTGCGIAREDHARIFEPFYTTKPRDVGTGLGMSLCAEIVRQHGGRIDVTSTVGKGTRVEVILPRGTAPAIAQAPRRARILLVDDDLLVRRAVRRMLEATHDIVDVEGGAAALALLKDDRGFDVVLCDIVMPEVDGPMVYEEIKAWAPELVPRVVFVTGGTFTRKTRDFAGSVSNVFLQKPVTRETLLGTIARVFAAPR